MPGLAMHHSYAWQLVGFCFSLLPAAVLCVLMLAGQFDKLRRTPVHARTRIKRTALALQQSFCR